MEEYDAVHKPRKSLPRSPPDTYRVELKLEDALLNEKKRKADEEATANTQKARKSDRRDTIRDSEADRESEIESISSEPDDDNVFVELTSEVDLTKHLEKIKAVLNEVRESAIKESEGSRGRITFTRAEQSKILNGVHIIQNEILTLVSKQQRTLLNVIELKETVSTLRYENEKMREGMGIREKDNIIEKLKTEKNSLLNENKYLKSSLNNKWFNSDNTTNRAQNITDIRKTTEKITDNITDNKESTQPKRTRYASIVTLPRDENDGQRIDESTSPTPVRKTIKKVLKETLSVNEIGGPTKAIIPLKTGGILIESYSDQQRKKIGSILSKDKRIEYKEIKNSDPVLQLSGIEKGYSDLELLTEIYNQNTSFKEAMSEAKWNESVKILTKRECRNKSKENILIQVKPIIYKTIMNLGGKIILDLLSIFVEEHLRVAVCHKCSQFGHVQKYCAERNGKLCPRCSGEHVLSECNAAEKSCPNCKRYSGLENVKHGANDQECPLYQKRLDIEKRKVRYSGDI